MSDRNAPRLAVSSQIDHTYRRKTKLASSTSHVKPTPAISRLVLPGHIDQPSHVTTSLNLADGASQSAPSLHASRRQPTSRHARSCHHGSTTRLGPTHATPTPTRRAPSVQHSAHHHRTSRLSTSPPDVPHRRSGPTRSIPRPSDFSYRRSADRQRRPLRPTARRSTPTTPPTAVQLATTSQLEPIPIRHGTFHGNSTTQLSTGPAKPARPHQPRRVLTLRNVP